MRRPIAEKLNADEFRAAPLDRAALAMLCLAAACSGNGEVGSGAGGQSAAGAGGSTGKGGAAMAGGNSSPDSGSGGSAGVDASSSTGGSMGSGGTRGTDGAGTGGTTGTGGTRGTGGSTGTDAAGTGGALGTGGATGAGGSGGATDCTTPPPASALIGWASIPGAGVTITTGGGNATPILVSTLAALNAAARGTAPAVIYVTGALTPGLVVIGSNKTVVGLCGAELHGHVDITNSNNIILRNVKIVGYGVGDCTLDPDFDPVVGCSSGNDAMTIQNNSHHVWVDHCDISDGTDGNLDITTASDFVTISWTKFHYTPRTDNVGNDSTGVNGHRFSNLIGSSDTSTTDVGHLNVTWHHDWWADNVNQRMPRTRFGQIHVFNNMYTSAGDSYCTNSGIQTHVLVENNIYTNVSNPLSPDANGDMLARGNLFQATRGTTTATGTGFTPPYVYTLDPTAALAATLTAQVGPH
jgi:pectate lyase